MRRTIDIDLEYQPLIDKPPVTPGDLYNQSCSGDKVTVETWREQWISQTKAAKERFGSFAEKSMGALYGSNIHKPVICLASGPSLKHSFDALRENNTLKNRVMVISALHNFGLLMDEGIKVDYWVSIDAGEIVLDDTVEFGSKDKTSYWDLTKDQTLIAAAFSHPKLFDQWQGQVYLSTALIPDPGLQAALQEIEPFKHYLSSGGNVGGAVFYIAKALFGSDPIMFCGYDYCFDYDLKFHSVKTKYDDYKGSGIGVTMKAIDVYGNSRKTWPSYWNFKCWHDAIACKVPGNYINCSDGLLGAYREGNISQFRYMPLDQALEPYKIAERVFIEERTAGSPEVVKRPFELAELFSDPKHPLDLTLF